MIARTDLPPRRTAPPVHMPDDFELPYDGFEPRFGPDKDHVMFALIGIENRGGDDAPVKKRLLDTFGGDHKPDVLEHGRVRKGYGPVAQIWFAYWSVQNDYALWLRRADVAALWNDDSLLSGPIGIWREAGRISLDHNETSSSTTEGLTGLVHLSDGIAITHVHGYWGSLRDRLVAAVDNALDGEGGAATKAPTAIGSRVAVAAHGNACFIRTSQDIAPANAEQASMYRSDVEPVLMDAVQFLRTNGAETGCIGMRFIEECDSAGTPMGRTCGAGFFESLAALEKWTHSHPTHMAIMGSFMAMVNSFQGNPGLQLWHEVTVFPVNSLNAVYVNCSTDGGLIGS